VNDNWSHFLKQIKDVKQVFLVGPMLKQTYTPVAPTIFVDGGCDYRADSVESNVATVSVGDGDSAVKPMEVELPRKKNYSDLAWVLRNLPSTIRHVELVGFRGGRLDHELANFGEAHAFLRDRKIFTTVRFEESVVGFAGGALKVPISGEFSLMVMEKAEVTMTGACQYPLEKPTVVEPCSSVGLSNVGSGAVLIACNKPAFLFLV